MKFKMNTAPVTVLLLVGCFAFAKGAWWNSSILYEIYPRSFADSDGDGNGDIRGIIQHVDYLKDLGVGIVWLTPIYPSPLKDNGYDISDFKGVNPRFGTLKDLKELIDKLHARGIKFIMDFVPNHSSDEHKWFQESKTGKGEYKDFYVWKNPKGWDSKGNPIPPNNWKSAINFKESAWTYNPVRKQFYLHNFGKFQPDFNFDNPKLVEALKDVIRFWLDFGCDGLRVDAVPFITEDPQLRDEQFINGCDFESRGGRCLTKIFTENTQGTYDKLKIFDGMLQKEYKDKMFFLEGYARRDQIMKYYQPKSVPFNFFMISNVTIDSNAKHLRNEVDSYMNALPQGMRWPNWQTGNHDNQRVATRFGPEIVDAMNMFVLLLPGVSVTYQGEEIGMSDPHLRNGQSIDPLERDKHRTPMQWDDTKHAGFSKAKDIWIPVNPNYWEVNVKSQIRKSDSHLSIYKKLSKYRKYFSDSVDLTTANYGDWVFAFKRTGRKRTCYVVVNLNNVGEDVVLSQLFSNLPASLRIAIQSRNSGFKSRMRLLTNQKIFLRPRSGVVLEP